LCPRPQEGVRQLEEVLAAELPLDMKCALRIRNGQSLNRLPGLLGGYSFYVPKPPTYLTRAQHPPSRARAQTGSSGGNATAGRERNASLLRIHHTPRAGRPAVPAVAYQGVSCRSLPIHGTSFATKVATSYFCILQSDLFTMVCARSYRARSCLCLCKTSRVTAAEATWSQTRTASFFFGSRPLLCSI
jgi:hypothetical protein